MINFYINWFDLVIIAVLVGLVLYALHRSFAKLVIICLFFIGGLFLGGWIVPHIIHIDDPSIFFIVNANVVLVFAVFCGILGNVAAEYARSFVHLHHYGTAETVVSVILSLCFGVILVWLLATMIGRLPFEGLSNSANDSLIVQLLDRYFPPVPAFFAEFDHALNPNNPMQVFVKTPFQVEYKSTLNSSQINAVVSNAQLSTVRITSFGCGGIASGSGTVIAPNLVMTNAHVVAGVKRPIVKYGSQSYAGVPVIFNSSEDIAVLRLKNFTAPAFSLSSATVPNGTQTVTLGYPGGNFEISPGAIESEDQIQSTNFYGYGSYARDVYTFEASVGPGSSGGPVVLLDGKLAGITFAKIDIPGNYAYALTSKSLVPYVNQAVKSTRRVSTGQCLSSV